MVAVGSEALIVMPVTTAEFDALKSQGWNSLDTTYDISYKSHWTMWHAIREFVQNALDEHDEAGVEALPTLKHTPGGLLISDQGRGIGAEALLLRETKRAAGDLRGQFGEGLKFACIAALREGYGVRIGSPLYTIRPIIRDYEMVGKSFQIISFLWKAEAGTQKGTDVLIERYRGPDYRERFFPFIRSAKTVDLHTVQVGRFKRTVSLTTTPANSLYVGDIFVRNLGPGDKASHYSYNLWNVPLNPDRDAETNQGTLWGTIARAWARAPQKLIENLLKQVQFVVGFEGQVVWDYSSVYEAGEPAISTWRTAWTAAYGDKGVLWTSDEWAKLAQSFGYRPIHMPAYFANYLSADGVIPTDAHSTQKLVGQTEVWRKELADNQLTNSQLSLLQEARRLTSAIEQRATQSSQLKVVAAKFSKNPETGTTVEGLWQNLAQTVSISDSMLTSDRDMLEVLLHELGHWFSKNAPDLTAEHTAGVAGVSVYALEVEKARVAVESTGRAPQKVAETVGVSAGPTRKPAGEMSWVELAAKAEQAGFTDVDHYSKAVLRRMLNLG